MRFKNNYCLVLLQLVTILGICSGAAASSADKGPDQGRVEIILEGPLKKLVDEGKADYQAHGKDSKFSVRAFMSFPAANSSAVRTVELSLRGQTSVELMDFPKYKIKFFDKNSLGLSESETLKIVSHGWEKDQGQIVGPGGGVRQSRLGVYREASVYDLLREAGVPVAQARRALITYKYTDAKKSITEPALLIESYSTISKRLGGAEVSLLKVSAEDQEEVSKSKWSSIIYLAEIMMGNWDFSIPTPESYDADLHNITLIRAADGSLTPFMEDFNMSNMVSMNPQLDPHIENDFFPEKSDIFRAKIWAFSSMKEEFEPSVIKKAIQCFLNQEERLMSMVQTLDVDEEGREHIKAHLVAFYEILHHPEYL